MTVLMVLAVIAQVSLQITKKCLSSRSVGMSKICASQMVPVEVPVQMIRMFLGNRQ